MKSMSDLTKREVRRVPLIRMAPSFLFFLLVSCSPAMLQDHLFPDAKPVIRTSVRRFSLRPSEVILSPLGDEFP